MAKETFQHPESREVWKHLETAALRSHQNTARAFDDFLAMALCSLSGGAMEDEYMRTIEPYTQGEKGKRAIDSFPHAMGALIEGIEKTRHDLLGDIFEGGVTWGEHGQFFTPEPVTKLMAQMTADSNAKTVCDPCVGSGRNLLAVAELNPRAEFYGQDVDIRCVRMTAINLAFRNLYGYVVWGDSLKNEKRRVFHTGFNGRGFVE